MASSEKPSRSWVDSRGYEVSCSYVMSTLCSWKPNLGVEPQSSHVSGKP
jgi:hypothetical protein